MTCLLAQAGKAPGGLVEQLFSGPWVPLIIVFLLFYVLMIRPERRKRAELADMLKNLKKNDRVVTIGGVFGTVVNVQNNLDEVTIRVDDNTNTRLRVQRSAIARVVTGESEPSP